MNYDNKFSRYKGCIQAVIFDWAGTTIDFGCMAPVKVFLEVFARQGIEISLEEARSPMGTHKKVHIRKITELASVREKWLRVKGRLPESQDVEKMFADFIPLQMKCLKNHADLIPQGLSVFKELYNRDYKIGSTTGYTREMMNILQPEVFARGYAPHAIVCADEVLHGRPYPFMIFENMRQLELSHVRSCVKVDDTPVGIQEGLSAGCWTVGVAISGNEVGLSLSEWEVLPLTEKSRLREKSYRSLSEAGAHFVIDTIADLLPCLDAIEVQA